MNIAILRLIRSSIFLLMVALMLVYRTESRLSAAEAGRILGAPSAKAAPAMMSAVRLDPCAEVCNPSVSCETECLFVWPELPPWDSTCGQYPQFDPPAPNCLTHDCGDDYCNEYDDEDAESCFEDCGYCQDDICTEGHEDANSCYPDCGVRDDGICSPAEACNGYAYCFNDCGSCANVGNECDEIFQNDTCGLGDICNPQQYCVAANYGNCSGLHNEYGCCLKEVAREVSSGNFICVPNGPPQTPQESTRR